MKPILSLIASFVACSLCAAQQAIVPSVNNLVGMDTQLSNTIISASIGEPAITTITSKNSIITQGFLQPELLPCVNLEFKYYPNPAKDIITIEAYGCDVTIVTIELMDLWGRHLTTSRPTRNNEFNLGDISPGPYIIKVNLSNEETHTITVLKMSN